MRKEDHVHHSDESIPAGEDMAPENKAMHLKAVTMVTTVSQAVKLESNSHHMGGDAMGMDGIVEAVAPQDRHVDWETRSPYAHDGTRPAAVNHFLSVVGKILSANKIPLNWNKQWKRSRNQ